jgi:hypothetical protein
MFKQIPDILLGFALLFAIILYINTNSKLQEYKIKEQKAVEYQHKQELKIKSFEQKYEQKRKNLEREQNNTRQSNSVIKSIPSRVGDYTIDF